MNHPHVLPSSHTLLMLPCAACCLPVLVKFSLLFLVACSSLFRVNTAPYPYHLTPHTCC